jgi:hypothetical protein
MIALAFSIHSIRHFSAHNIEAASLFMAFVEFACYSSGEKPAILLTRCSRLEHLVAGVGAGQDMANSA